MVCPRGHDVGAGRAVVRCVGCDRSAVMGSGVSGCGESKLG